MSRHSSFDLSEKVEKLTVISCLAVLSLIYLSVQVEGFLKDKTSPTLDNLQKAYNSESNSNVMYLNFAEKARDEGHQEVALLFKTLAHAEKNHRDNHAQLIEVMEATPTKTMIVRQATSTVEQKVDSTNKNLSKLIQGDLSSSVQRESGERQMYSKFIKQARLDNNLAALKIFETALVEENLHSQLLAQVQGNLDD